MDRETEKDEMGERRELLDGPMLRQWLRIKGPFLSPLFDLKVRRIAEGAGTNFQILFPMVERVVNELRCETGLAKSRKSCTSFDQLEHIVARSVLKYLVLEFGVPPKREMKKFAQFGNVQLPSVLRYFAAIYKEAIEAEILETEFSRISSLAKRTGS